MSRLKVIGSCEEDGEQIDFGAPEEVNSLVAALEYVLLFTKTEMFSSFVKQKSKNIIIIISCQTGEIEHQIDCCGERQEIVCIIQMDINQFKSNLKETAGWQRNQESSMNV